MLKRITALLLCLCVAAGLFPAVSAHAREPVAQQSVDQCNHTLRVDTLDPNYTRPAYDGYLIEITPQRVEDHFRYLNEVYVEEYPEAALVVDVADAEDRAVLKKLAQIITDGCTTNTEKANAIDAWLRGSIEYDVDASAYANDTFYNLTGNCLSYANLMQVLLRSLGIPAVVGDGWRGDMKTNTVELFDYEGHAWCFVYLEGEWVLYDPLWIVGGTTDRDYIAEWIYLDTVEFVTPAYDGENLPPESWNKPKVYYTGGVWYNWAEGYPNGFGNYTMFVNNQGYNFTPSQDEWETDGPFDGWVFVDGTDDTTMHRGELYRNGWISYGDYNDDSYLLLTYAHVNGMQIDGAVMEYDGVERYMRCNVSFPILADPADYSIQYGVMAFRPGYVGPFLDYSWGSVYNTDEYRVTWTNENPEIATVDENGILTAIAPGWAEVELKLIRVSDNAHISNSYISFYISDEERVADFCGGNHRYETTVTAPTCTEDGCTTYTCTICGDSYTEDGPPAFGHGWSGTKCKRCGLVRLTPFDDVVVGAFYEAPVAWAVENGITNGISATEFGPNATCNRAQVVTFLWRAVGCPEPESLVNPFVDVEAGSFYEKPVLWAVEQGITNGIDATHFGPNAACNRASVVTFLWRTAGKPSPTTSIIPFADVAEGSWYADAVLWAVENGITNGFDATLFAPITVCNRAQVVTFLYRAHTLLKSEPNNPVDPDVPTEPEEPTEPEPTDPEEPRNPGVSIPPSDPNGTTYILNLSTMKFHYPSCFTVERIAEDNYHEYVGTREVLLEYGYDPCGHCDP